MTILVFVLTAVIAYFCGCFNGAVIVSKYIMKNDVRQYGSGNAGLTNFYRVFGGSLTFVVILTDVLKAVIAVLVGSTLFGSMLYASVLGKYWAALFCLLGHMFPIFFQFKGGKGVLSGGAIALMIDWRIALVVWGGFIVLFLLTKYVSLGSVWAGASFPFATLFVYRNLIIFILGLLCGGLVVWKHRTNIDRLLKGTESKFTFHKKN